jgi:hypothetical protein
MNANVLAWFYKVVASSLLLVVLHLVAITALLVGRGLVSGLGMPMAFFELLLCAVGLLYFRKTLSAFATILQQAYRPRLRPLQAVGVLYVVLPIFAIFGAYMTLGILKSAIVHLVGVF